MTNRLKGVDLVDRLPEKLWIKVYNTLQEVVTKTIPKKKKCRKAKSLSEEALKIPDKRREVKGKGERKIYTQLQSCREKKGEIRKPY